MAALIQRRSRRCPVDEVISGATLNGMSPAFKSPRRLVPSIRGELDPSRCSRASFCLSPKARFDAKRDYLDRPLGKFARAERHQATMLRRHRFFRLWLSVRVSPRSMVWHQPDQRRRTAQYAGCLRTLRMETVMNTSTTFLASAPWSRRRFCWPAWREARRPTTRSRSASCTRFRARWRSARPS